MSAVFGDDGLYKHQENEAACVNRAEKGLSATMNLNRNSKFIKQATLMLLLCISLLLVSPSRAYGYADPGTGAFVYQAAYAAFLGGVFYFRKILDRFWNRRR